MIRITGTARVDKKTKHLAQRLHKGEIAVIDHQDLDSTCARMLVDRKAGAVINASPCISGRYPNTGPGILLSAGIPIVDNVGTDIMTAVREGDVLHLRGGAVLRNGERVADGLWLTEQEIARMTEKARSNLSSELEKFAQNTLQYIQDERFLLLDPVEVPDLKTQFARRHVLVVVRGEGFVEDLASIRSYIQDVKPVLIGVDGGADALLDAGLQPHIVVGDMDSVTDGALRCGAELVVHAYADGRAPGLARVRDLGLDAKVFPLQGTSEDMAMLLAYENGADLIVAVGTHSHLIDFLDKGRAGMASTFLTRLKIGPKLVDAKGVSKLHRRNPKVMDIAVLVLAAMAPIAVLMLQSPVVRTWSSVALFKIRRLLGL